MDKKKALKRRAVRVRHKLQSDILLKVYRTNNHMRAQIVEAGKVLVSASTLDKTFKEKGIITSNIAAAKEIGLIIAEKAKAKGISKLAFDRSGFRYHGRIKALADGAREGGIEF